jgi:nucleotide-binding universal stress UspA family protein
MAKLERILIPLDRSATSESALDMATTLAKKFESQLVLLYVVDLPALALPAINLPDPPSWAVEVREHIDREAQEYLQAQKEKLEQQGYRIETLLKEMSPAERIVEVAETESIDLIVMTTHGQGGLTRWALGSVADRVARHASCPVLLIRKNETE